MKRVLLILCLLLSASELCANSAPFFPQFQPINGNTIPVENYNNSITSLPNNFAAPKTFNFAIVNKIEQSLFGHSFGNQNIVLRLSRIEKSLFNTTYPTASTEQRLDNIISNFNQLNKYPNISRNTLSKIESKIFNQTFPQNDTERRVERLEQEVFGAVQSGDMNLRYQNLLAASKKFNPDMVINSYYPSNGPKLRNVLGGLGGMLSGGNMTGFTPPIEPYATGNYENNSFANTPFNNIGSGSGIYRGYGTNNGPFGYSYGESYNNYGSGAGVHILD